MCISFRKRRRSEQSGFSLVEILIAMIVVSLIGTVLFTAFSQGLRLWKRAAETAPDHQSEILFELIAGDLRNVYTASLRDFAGDERRLEFFSFSRQDLTDSEGRFRIKQPAFVRYYFDTQKNKIMRSEESFKELLGTGTNEPAYREITGNFRDCRFDFYHEIPGRNGFQWKPFWHAPCPPKAVRISLHYDDQKKTGRSVKIIPLPVGGCPGT